MSEKAKQFSCSYYPCHKEVESCAFCYCPIYPCLDPITGGQVILDERNANIWDCHNCTIMHNSRFVDKLKNTIKKIVIKELKKLTHEKN